jgi:hypothetical protein
MPLRGQHAAGRPNQERRYSIASSSGMLIASICAGSLGPPGGCPVCCPRHSAPAWNARGSVERPLAAVVPVVDRGAGSRRASGRCRRFGPSHCCLALFPLICLAEDRPPSGRFKIMRCGRGYEVRPRMANGRLPFGDTRFPMAGSCRPGRGEPSAGPGETTGNPHVHAATGRRWFHSPGVTPPGLSAVDR